MIPMRVIFAAAGLALLALASCSGPQSIDAAAVTASTQRIEPRVAQDCRVLEVAGAVATVAAIAVPGAGVIDVVVDLTCSDPEMTARAIALGEEHVKRLRDQR